MEKTQVPAKKEKMRVLKPALICVLVLTLLCGVIYPLLVTGISQLFFHDQANGSIITVTLKKDLTVTTTDEETGEESTQVYPAGETVAIGSAYMGQEFTSPQYLIGRPTPGAPTNLSPESEEHAQMVQERIDFFHELDPSNTADIPMGPADRFRQRRGPADFSRSGRISSQPSGEGAGHERGGCAQDY